MEIKLKKEDWDNTDAIMKEADRLNLTERMGYLAWCAGQGANGYVSVISFLKDITDCCEQFKR